MSKYIQNLVFELTMRNSWLAKFEEKVEALFRDFESDDQVGLLSELLENFVFLEEETVHRANSKLIDMLRSEWGLCAEKTLICAIAQDNAPDSSQVIVYQLKGLCADVGWEPHIISSIAKLYSEVKRGQFENIVLIDSFVGTGGTMSNKIRFVDNEIAKIDSEYKYNLFVVSTAAMEFARETIVSAGANAKCIRFEYYPQMSLKRGLSESYPPDTYKKHAETMLGMEFELNQDPGLYGLAKFPSFGWEQSEALFAIERANIPNSVFPIFWWKHLANGEKRRTMFSRNRNA